MDVYFVYGQLHYVDDMCQFNWMWFDINLCPSKLLIVSLWFNFEYNYRNELFLVGTCLEMLIIWNLNFNGLALESCWFYWIL